MLLEICIADIQIATFIDMYRNSQSPGQWENEMFLTLRAKLFIETSDHRESICRGPKETSNRLTFIPDSQDARAA